jgi:hypothetical protein
MEKLGLNVIPEQIRIFEKEAELSPQMQMPDKGHQQRSGSG